MTKGDGNYSSSSYGDTPWYISREKCTEVIIEDGVTGVSDYMFYGCTNLGNITLPESVKSIGDYAFTGCKNLGKLTVYNPECTFGTQCTSYYTTIVGYAGSTAEAYANETDFAFELLESCEHKNNHTERKDPTCTQSGYEKIICVDCGLAYSYVEIPTIGHTMETIVAEPTCQKAGSIVHYCTVCKYAYLEKITDPVDHDMRWVMVTKPTSSADGVKNYSCSYCGLVEDTKVVPAFLISDKSVASIDFDSNTISGFDAGATSIDDYVSVETDGYSFTCDSAVIGTGTVIELTDGDTVITEFTAVVFGDVNGDGWYDGTDSIIVSCLANGLLSKDDVSPAFYTAADCNHDGVIDSFDVAILEQAGLLLSNVDQSKSNEELATDEAFIEYLDLIDQTPDEDVVEEEETPQPEEDVETPETEELNLIEFIINIIKKLFELLISYLPIK